MRGSSDLLACQVLVLIEDLANMWLDDHVLKQSESSQQELVRSQQRVKELKIQAHRMQEERSSG